jgi:ferritin-like metal-binding protein YciE
VTRRLAEELADAVGLLIRDARYPAERRAATKRLCRVVERIEEAAFKRGANAQFEETEARINRIRDAWERASSL